MELRTQIKMIDQKQTVELEFTLIPILTLWGEEKRAAARQYQQNDVRPAKTQISRGIRPVWSESSLWAQ